MLRRRRRRKSCRGHWRKRQQSGQGMGPSPAATQGGRFNGAISITSPLAQQPSYHEISLNSLSDKSFLPQRLASPSPHCYSQGFKMKYELKGILELMLFHFLSVLELTSISHIYFQIQADWHPYHLIIKLNATNLLNTSPLFLSNLSFLPMRSHSALSEWFLLLPHLKRQTQKKPFRRIAN